METIAKITIRCFVLGVAVLLCWFFMYLLAGDWMYGIHSRWFELSRHEFAVIHYCGMGLCKLVIFMFFLFPYIACRLCAGK